jgi:hypothetical protein
MLSYIGIPPFQFSPLFHYTVTNEYTEAFLPPLLLHYSSLGESENAFMFSMAGRFIV